MIRGLAFALCGVAWHLHPPSSELSTMQLRQAAKKQMCHGRKGMNNSIISTKC